MASTYYVKTQAKLDDIPYSQGNVIYCEFDRSVRVDDNSGQRQNYALVVDLQTDAQRTALGHPINAIYFVQETGVLWKYTDKWVQLTFEASQQIVFASRDEFPQLGVSKRLYVDGLDIYRWKNGRYQLMNSKHDEWEPIGNPI